MYVPKESGHRVRGATGRVLFLSRCPKMAAGDVGSLALESTRYKGVIARKKPCHRKQSAMGYRYFWVLSGPGMQRWNKRERGFMTRARLGNFVDLLSLAVFAYIGSHDKVLWTNPWIEKKNPAQGSEDRISFTPFYQRLLSLLRFHQNPSHTGFQSPDTASEYPTPEQNTPAMLIRSATYTSRSSGVEVSMNLPKPKTSPHGAAGLSRGSVAARGGQRRAQQGHLKL